MIRLFRYFIIGGISAIIDLGIFSLFAYIFGWPWFFVSIVSFIIATLANYFLSINFVFVSGVRYKKRAEITGVFIISGLALVVNQVVLYIGIEWLQWPLIVSKITATGMVFFWNYFGRRHFIF